MARLGQIEQSVEIDIEEILDDLDTDVLEEYLEERYERQNKDRHDAMNAKQIIINLCVGKRSRNVFCDKEVVKSTMLDIIDEVFY